MLILHLTVHLHMLGSTRQGNIKRPGTSHTTPRWLVSAVELLGHDVTQLLPRSIVEGFTVERESVTVQNKMFWA